MNDIVEQVTAQQCFALECEDLGIYTYMSPRFWKGTELCRDFVCRSSLPSTDLAEELGSLSRLVSVVSTRADIVACSGCLSALARTIDNSEFSTCGLQSCFRFESLPLSRLMHKSSYSVFGHIDFFSVLQSLMISLGSSLTEDCVLRSPVLSKVIIHSHKLSYQVVDKRGQVREEGTTELIIFLLYRPRPPATWTFRSCLHSAEILSLKGGQWPAT